MMNLKKLSTFTLRDQFGWDREYILAEANEMAIRHSDMVGWKSVEIRDITAIPAKDGQYLCYQFEIWGLGLSDGETDHNDSAQNVLWQAPSYAAKQSEI